MKIGIYKTGELKGSSYVKIPLKSSASINIKNIDIYCFVWSILAKLHPCENDHPNRVSKFIQYFVEIIIEGFDFTNGFRCTDVQIFEELNSLSINIFEINFYQNQNKWKQNLIPNEISKNESDRVLDLLIQSLLIYPYALNKKLIVFLGDRHKNFICGRCVNSYTSQNKLTLHKPKSENNDTTTIRTSSDSHFHWKEYFHKNLLYIRIYADFEAKNENDSSIIGKKTTNIYNQNPVLKDYHIESELEDVLKNCHFRSPLGYNNVDWFKDEVIKLENEMAFFFKKTGKDNIMT